MNLSEEDILKIRQIARDSVFEPFEGKQDLERIKKTRSGLNKRLDSLKQVTKKSQEWLGNSKLLQHFKKKENTLGEKEPSGFAKILKKWDEATVDLQYNLKKTYKSLEEKTKVGSLVYLKKALEALLYDNPEKWITKRAPTLLKDSNLKSIEDIRNLPEESRQKLIDSLYPYNNPNLERLSKALDISMNVGLGAVVVTNLPMTGIAVGLVNMMKTIIKMAHRINIMSAIYGWQIVSPDALFRVSARLLEAMEDWENNPSHMPQGVELFDELYIPLEGEETGFAALMNASIKKDAYITIPGVGMISIRKIALDDFKMDLLIKNLMIDYFTKKKLIEKYSSEIVFQILEDFRSIYLELISKNSIEKKKKWLEEFIEEHKKTTKIEGDTEGFVRNTLFSAGTIIKAKWKGLSSDDMILDFIWKEIDDVVLEIYKGLQKIPKTEYQRFISREVDSYLLKV
ncbi:MAG: hypothetical protein AAF518_04730 [Spirochaetota bacterium]